MESVNYVATNKSAALEGEQTARAVSLRRRVYDRGMRGLLWLSAGITCALLVFLMGYILWRGIPQLSWQFLTSAESVLKGTLGILPAICNTLYVVCVTLCIALPLGVGAAVYLTEYATNHKLVSAIEFAAETLSGIPSILYALVGYLAFCKTLGLGYSLLAASLALAMMNLPTIIRTTQESLKTVPQSYREGALGLGSGKWHMIRTVVLPSSSRLAEDGKRHLSGGTDAFSLSFLGWKMEISSGELRQMQQAASRLYRQYGVLIPAGWRAAGESVWLLRQIWGG